MHTAHSHNVHIQRHAIAQHAVLEGDPHTHSGNLMPSDEVCCTALASHARAISLCTEDTRIIFLIHASSVLINGGGIFGKLRGKHCRETNRFFPT